MRVLFLIAGEERGVEIPLSFAGGVAVLEGKADKSAPGQDSSAQLSFLRQPTLTPTRAPARRA